MDTKHSVQLFILGVILLVAIAVSAVTAYPHLVGDGTLRENGALVVQNTPTSPSSGLNNTMYGSAAGDSPMPTATSTATSSFPEIDISLSPYIEVVDSCGPYYTGNSCVNMRSGPGTQYPILAKLRQGVVLKVADATTTSEGQWYSVFVDDVILHPERVISDWYVSAELV